MSLYVFLPDAGKLITWGSTDDLGQSYVTAGKHGVGAAAPKRHNCLILWGFFVEISFLLTCIFLHLFW